jgi:transcriptional regulator with XRE-family HTH domain
VSAFGRLLKQMLAERGLTQAEFARRVGVSQAAISQVVRGKYPPALDRAEDWVRALDLHGRQAQHFLLLYDIANSPPRIQRIMERQVKWDDQ